jgi:NAD(P)-dependent dehydrogenase (short-subunit alcohol dehydrogenase family)
MKVAVIDGQGGGIGKHITEKIRKELGASIEIIGLGTN